MRRALLPLLSLPVLFLSVSDASAQRGGVPGTLVYAVGDDAPVPLPIIGQGQGNLDVSDMLFMRLAVLGPTRRTTGDNALAPALARSWHRVDPLTIDFDIDPRAHWQDGKPVTAHDVVFTWSLNTNPKINTDQTPIELIESVKATGERTVRVHFRRAYAEQVYNFAFDCRPLPSHLLETMAPESIATSDFPQHPVGDGPYRFERRVPGQSIELRADTTFFLGRPSLSRIVYRIAAAPQARVNMLLSGESDVMENVAPGVADQIQAKPEFRFVTAPSNNLLYMLFNTRSPADTAKPHPILGDDRVREALILALDRETMTHSAFGQAARVPDAAQSQVWNWINAGNVAPTRQNVARARALLAAAGWKDTDHDSVLDKNGVPLRIHLIYPSSSAPRIAMALQAQQMWRAVGVDVTLEQMDFPAYRARHNAGNFDLDFASALQDPSPMNIVQSWSCASARTMGSSNVAHWCDPEFDRLVNTATLQGDPVAWRAALARMTKDHPAIFIAAPVNLVAVHTRYENVSVLPVRTWLSLWQWRVRPDAALARDH